MRIYIVVGGRFHSDHLAEALLSAGHDVRLFTTMPRSRFPKIDPKRIHSFVLGEVAFRLLEKCRQGNLGDRLKVLSFGQYLLKAVSDCDTLISWSSFGLELFQRRLASRMVLIRDSPHIAFQNKLLEEEYRNLEMPFANRKLWIEREEAEYQLADEIVVLSKFAQQTFEDKGIRNTRILTLGVDTFLFAPRNNLALQKPLQVVFFGYVCVRKGIHYLLEATKDLADVKVHIVGGMEKGYEHILSRFSHFEYHSPMDHSQLSSFLRTMDVFVLPTLDDGFAMALLQAGASGLIPIVTDHCGASELFSDGKSAHIVPIRNAQAIREKLLAILANPKATQMKQEAIAVSRKSDWSEYRKCVVEMFGRSRSKNVGPSSLSLL